MNRPPAPDPFALLCSLVLDTGERWGDAATSWQRADALSVLAAAQGTASPRPNTLSQTEPGSEPSETDARRQFHLRGRGMSKTTDAAALALVLLLTVAPARSRSHAYAADADQAGIMLDTIHGLAERSGLLGAVDIGARNMTVRGTGATLSVESADGASAYGLRPWLTLVDELGAWPRSANHRRLWGAIVSAVPKVPGSILLVIGTAGSPSGIGAEVWTEAETSPHWRASRHPGPAPWWAAEDIAATRRDLSPSEYRRLILCEWAEGDDALAVADDVAACIRPGSTSLTPRAGVRYVAALDIGTRRDLTALVVGHSERRAAGVTYVIDRVLSWRPDKKRDGRVDLAEVEAAALRVCREYRVDVLRFDRMQAEQMTANLTRAGVRTSEFVFSAAGANRLARTMWGALRDHALELPDDEETRAEFLTTRLVETGPSTIKLANPPGSHDDIVTAVGMVLVDLADRGEPAEGARIYTPVSALARINRALPPLSRSAAQRAPTPAQVRALAERNPRGLKTILGVPGAWDAP